VPVLGQIREPDKVHGVAAKPAWVLLALASVMLAAGCGGRATGGPLADPFGFSESAPKDVGKPMSTWFTLRNRGHEPATIERVRLVDRDPALHLLGVVTLPVAVIGGGSGFVSGFPPPPMGSGRARPQPIAGAVVAPGDYAHGTPLVVGIAASAPGIHSFRGVVLDYRVGGKKYRAVYGESAAICTPKRRYVKADCSAPQPVEPSGS
jgi:hypothetical protein